MKLNNIILILLIISACSSDDDPTLVPDIEADSVEFYYGADLSYVNEMEDCGAEYKNSDNEVQDPFEIFSEAGANLVRVRLWHNPTTWTAYSNFDDVKKTIQRAKDENMQVLLDFHYSDTWADPTKQEIPAAWIDHIDHLSVLGDSLYNYTYNTLTALADADLLPNIVQVGNEINPMILQEGEIEWPIDWTRNSALLNKGITAVRDVAEERNKEIDVMLHIAQPENALWWFEQATENGVTDFDWIGVSYYPVWSDYELSNVGDAFATLVDTYDKRLMVVETAYPFTLDDVDNANNILGPDAIINGYPASQQGQLNYLKTLRNIINFAGGEGLVYWEPAWVSTNCSTLWAQGSHWDNAALFDNEGKPTLGLQIYNETIE